MRAAQFGGPRMVALQEVADPHPGPDEVLIQVRACGICGSDLHRYRAGDTGTALTPGHEIAGTVAGLGEGVEGWDPGTPVAVEPLVTCRTCDACRRGDYQICPQRVLLGGGQNGGLAELVVVPAYGLFALPPALPFTIGALAEPVAVAVHGVRLAEVRPGQRVLVQGAGTIGLLTALVAQEAGAQVTITARYPHQATASKEFGAQTVYPADDHGTAELRRHAARTPWDVVIETVGGEADTLVQAPALVRPGGTVCVLGIFLHPPPIGALALVLREVRMVGAITYSRADGDADFARAIALLQRHQDLLSTLITFQRPLARLTEAFALADDKASRALKVTITP